MKSVIKIQINMMHFCKWVHLKNVALVKTSKSSWRKDLISTCICGYQSWTELLLIRTYPAPRSREPLSTARHVTLTVFGHINVLELTLPHGPVNHFPPHGMSL